MAGSTRVYLNSQAEYDDIEKIIVAVAKSIGKEAEGDGKRKEGKDAKSGYSSSQVKLIKKALSQFVKNIREQTKRHVRLRDDPSFAGEEEPLDLALKKQKEALAQSVEDSLQELAETRTNVPAYIQRVVEATVGSSASSSSAAESKNRGAPELPEEPSEEELARLVQVHDEIAAELARLQEVLPKSLEKTRSLREVIEKALRDGPSSVDLLMMAPSDAAGVRSGARGSERKRQSRGGRASSGGGSKGKGGAATPAARRSMSGGAGAGAGSGSGSGHGAIMSVPRDAESDSLLGLNDDSEGGGSSRSGSNAASRLARGRKQPY